MNLDPSMAYPAVVKLCASIAVISLVLLGIWQRFYRTRTGVSLESGDRARFEAAIRDAAEARKEAHTANNQVMVVQRELGKLEAENKACNDRADRQDAQIARLEAENKMQARQLRVQGKQIAVLMKLDTSASDFGEPPA